MLYFVLVWAILVFSAFVSAKKVLLEDLAVCSCFEAFKKLLFATILLKIPLKKGPKSNDIYHCKLS